MEYSKGLVANSVPDILIRIPLIKTQKIYRARIPWFNKVVYFHHQSGV